MDGAGVIHRRDMGPANRRVDGGRAAVGFEIWTVSLKLSSLLFSLSFLFIDDGPAEMFSWAKLPWEEVTDNEVIPLIQRRVKLPYPGPICPQPIYDVMLSCWKLGLSVLFVVMKL